MAATIRYEGPEPPAGRQFCYVCVFVYKGQMNKIRETEIAAANALGPEETKTVYIGQTGRPVKIREPQLAVTSGYMALPQDVATQMVAQLMGQKGLAAPPGMIFPPVVVPLCWTHAMAVELKEGGFIQGVAAGALNGLDGAALLNQRRQR